eukprot:GHVL01025262.1.p1 GENE.GHVL01025262.1~~GHVL01025262.1.p1  ORF type:complete len:110 (+),score=11.71 GHVL01025262.1:768-1097(+)
MISIKKQHLINTCQSLQSKDLKLEFINPKTEKENRSLPSSTQRLASVVLELAIRSRNSVQLKSKRPVDELKAKSQAIGLQMPLFSSENIGFKIPSPKWRPITFSARLLQ